MADTQQEEITVPDWQKRIDRQLRETVQELAGGARLRLNSDGYWILIRDLHQPEGDIIDLLMHRGWLETMPNGGSCKLSDEGLKAYLRSTDELGSGKLLHPHEWRN